MAAFFAVSGIESHAAWLIDSKKFQTSVHGEISCIECHENITEADLHPNPADVNKKLSVFFSQEQCLMCHEEILDDLKEVSHGSESVEDRKKYEYCIGCHDPHYMSANQTKAAPEDLPPFSQEDIACMSCHEADDPESPKGKEKTARFCFHCHGASGSPAQKITKTMAPLINSQAYESTPHADIACTVCHDQAAKFPHTDQKTGDCRQCHPLHDEKVTHAAHIGIACEACHLQGVQLLKNGKSRRILWSSERNLTQVSDIHHMAPAEGLSTCRRCHFRENEIGAAAMILPAKSILCMPCHAATFSVGDTTTLITLFIFFVGIIMMFSYFLTGTMDETRDAGAIRTLLLLCGSGIRSLFSKNFLPVIRALVFDVLFQQRLYRQSQRRWLIHSLIFFPFVFRFLWGIFALTASLWFPGWLPVWDMLDKNHPITAFLFDLTGLMIMMGVVIAFLRATFAHPLRPKGLPKQDRWALGLIAGIIFVGFILEGMRIAMTGWPQGSGFAFIGYGISQFFTTGASLNLAYGYVWYLHAVFTGAFFVYLPFSRLSHIIIAPFVLAMRAVEEEKHGKAVV